MIQITHVLADALQNMLGAFDTPVRRMKYPSDFGDEAIKSAHKALVLLKHEQMHDLYRSDLASAVHFDPNAPLTNAILGSAISGGDALGLATKLAEGVPHSTIKEPK